MMVLSVAVIGAGAAGLASARRLAEAKIFYDVYEQSDSVGGTWVYDERSVDQYGQPIHSSMYQNLRTNLPKEVMAFPDFPITAPDKSYVPAEVILNYLKAFAEHFKVLERIKFNTKVHEVRPKGSKWTVTSKNLVTSQKVTTEYDAVMVCSGHYHTPNIPSFEGADQFQGKIIHSHDYRKPDIFAGLSVVIVGGGPSGLDIALDVSTTAKQVYLSHHLKDIISTQFPSNFVMKPDVNKISGKNIHFVDGTHAEADIFFYCTGYVYKFPFLHKDCEVTVKDNYTFPLFKHLIAIRNPALCFVGLPFYVCSNAMFDLQSRFFIATLKGSYKLPSQEAMLEDERKEVALRRSMGFSLRQFHKMGPLQGAYYDDLAKTADIAGIAPVMTKLHNESSRRFLEDLHNFRSDRYEIISDQEFIELEPCQS